MDDAASPKPSVIVGTHLRPPRDQSRKRSSIGANREQSESRKHLRQERNEAEEVETKEGDMSEACLAEVKASFQQLKLERDSRMRQDGIQAELRMRVRCFCCSCEQDTGVKERKCISYRHYRCPTCYVEI